MHILTTIYEWIKKRIAWFLLGGVVMATGAILATPDVVPDANPVLRTERRFNDSVSVVKRNETTTSISGKWKNYYLNGEWVDIDTTLTQTPDGFCADKMPFAFCAPLRSTGEAVFTANNQYDIFGKKVITDAPLEERMTAVGVNDVAGQLMFGEMEVAGGPKGDVQYVVYPGAYNDSDLIYFVDEGAAPRLSQLVRWNVAPTCVSSLTRTFISKYSVPVKIINSETTVEWDKKGQLTLAGEPLKIGVSETRGIGKKPFHIWDSARITGKLEWHNVRRIDVKLTTAPGQNAYAITKILPCDFFATATYPVYTDTTSVFNPDADPETSTADATTQHNEDGLSWTNLRAGAGNGANDAATTMPISINDRETAGSGFKLNGAALMGFNTGPTIPAGDTISSASLKMRVTTKTDPTQLNALNIVMAGNTGSWTTAIAGTEYDTRDNAASSTPYSNYVVYADITSGADETFTLNATAIATIAKGSGISRFSLQNHLDMADSPTPTFIDNSAEDGDEVRFQSSDGAVDPELTVIHAVVAAAGGTNEEEGIVPSFIYWPLYDMKVAVYYGLQDSINTAYAAIK